MMIANMVVTKPHVAAGRLRAYAVAAPRRSSHLPQAPTTAEAGLPGLEVPQFYALFAPARVAPAALRRIEQDVGQILATPAFHSRIDAQGADIVASDPRALAAFMREQVAAYRKTALAAGIKAD